MWHLHWYHQPDKTVVVNVVLPLVNLLYNVTNEASSSSVKYCQATICFLYIVTASIRERICVNLQDILQMLIVKCRSAIYAATVVVCVTLDISLAYSTLVYYGFDRHQVCLCYWICIIDFGIIMHRIALINCVDVIVTVAFSQPVVCKTVRYM